MQSRTLLAPAKVNLALDVTGRRPDGYHLLWTIMQSISIGDQVRVQVDPSADGIHLSCGRARLPADSRNTAWRAAAVFIAEAELKAGVKIILQKKIPTAAGLAGGSTDAAAVLAALENLYPGRISRHRLFELAARIGADVPFCLEGGTVLCQGIGEVLTPLPAWEDIPILLVKPGFGLSTPWIFGQFRLDNPGPRPDQAAVLKAVRTRDLQALSAATNNVLESVSLAARPELARIKTLLAESGAGLTLMSGSGPTIFGLYSTRRDCEAARDYLTGKLLKDTMVIMGRTVAHGPFLLED